VVAKGARQVFETAFELQDLAVGQFQKLGKLYLSQNLVGLRKDMEILRILLLDVLESVHLAIIIRMHDFGLHPIDLFEQRHGSAI
jgi:hypothetical protein